jgi:hypothetical protein
VSLADLSSVHVKLDRAETHLDEFDKQASSVISACLQSVIREYSEDETEYVFRLRKVPSVPPVLSAIVGDAVHNLRVSLDHLAWQLVIATGREPGARTSFPVRWTPPRPDANGYSLPQIFPGVPMDLRMTLDEVQPYKLPKPAHHSLAVLSKLDNKDKHQQLLVAILALRGPGAVSYWRGEGDMTAVYLGPYRDGAEISRFAYSGLEKGGEFAPTFNFAVGLSELGAGPWGLMVGAAELVRRSSSYIENEIIPRFKDYAG